jgi:hypothetical protein
MIKLTYMIKASDVLNIAREAGYEEFLEEVDYIASLFWPEDFMNDCYKDLFIDDESYEEICEDIEGCEDEDEMKELVAKKVIIEALRKYCLDNGIKTDSLLVDVSW